MERQTQMTRLRAYGQLMRIDKPIGTLLLLWPTCWALWLSGMSMPPLKILLVFIAGVFVMRAAGCVINDFADRKFDGHVKRTCSRPLVTQMVSEKEAKRLFLALILVSFVLVLTMNRITIALSLVGLALAWVYPFMKRHTHFPQLVLGAAFGWAIPMAWAAVSESLPITCWLVFLANICWTMAYDTQYAMVDKDDDIRIGIKSTAILFGRFDKMIIALLQLMTLLLMVWTGILMQLNPLFFVALLLAALLFFYQQCLIAGRQREKCFQAFLNNNYVGLILFAGIALTTNPVARWLTL